MDSDAATAKQARQFLEEFASTAQPLESELLAELLRFYNLEEPGRVLELASQLEELYSSRKSYVLLSRWVEQLKEPVLRRRVASLRQRFSEFQGDRQLRRQMLGRIEEYLNTDAEALEMPATPARRRLALPYRHPMDCGDWGLGFLRASGREQREALFRRLYTSTSRRAALIAEIFALRARINEERGADVSVEFDPEQHILVEDETRVPVPQLLAQLRLETEPMFQELLARRGLELGVSSLEWWDLLAEPAELHEELERRLPAERCLDLARRTLRSVGFDPDALGISVLLDERPQRGRHAYRFPLLGPRDVRVLARSGAGIRAVELLIHGLGHALYTSQVEQDVWEFRGPASVCFSEAIGQLLARICRTPEWLTGTARLPEELARRVRRVRAEQELVRLRGLLALARFESEALGQDADTLDLAWRERVASELRVPTEPGLYIWAQVRHFAMHPGHLQSLALAELVAVQLWSHYARHLGGLVDNEALGRRMARDIFRHGGRYPWPQLLLKITGRGLGADSLARHFQDELAA